MDYLYHKLKGQLAVLKDVLSEYGTNHTLDNVIKQIQSRIDHIENK